MYLTTVLPCRSTAWTIARVVALAHSPLTRCPAGQVAFCVAGTSPPVHNHAKYRLHTDDDRHNPAVDRCVSTH